MSDSESDINMMEQLGQEDLQMAALKAKMTLEYARFELWPMDKFPTKFGDVNDQIITTERKVSMTESFKKSGVQQVKDDTCITIPVDPAWIVIKLLITQSINGLALKVILILVLTEEGKKALVDGLIRPLEGMGRRGGLEYLYNELTARITKIEGKLKAL